MNNTGQQQQIKVDLSGAEGIKCGECDGELFVPVFFVKRISALVSPTGKEVMVPLQTFQCTSCSHVNEEFTKQ
tara:strand:- start:533 stop:751 length:219 start_codon:yes stop_codon:yes gene_type:complete